ISARGHIGATPARVAVAGGRWTAVTGWAGPWPADERWWDPAERRRRARLQVGLADGSAHLLALEEGRWWVEATYDRASAKRVAGRCIYREYFDALISCVNCHGGQHRDSELMVTRVRGAASRTFRSLHNRNFRVFFLGQLVSMCGSWMQIVAQGWLVLR